MAKEEDEICVGCIYYHGEGLIDDPNAECTVRTQSLDTTLNDWLRMFLKVCPLAKEIIVEEWCDKCDQIKDCDKCERVDLENYEPQRDESRE